MSKNLSEKQHQKTEKKLITIANIVAIIGVILVLTLFIVGVVKKSNRDETIAEYEKEISVLEQDVKSLDKRMRDEAVENPSSSRYHELVSQKNTMQTKLAQLVTEKIDKENDKSSFIVFFVATLVVLVSFGGTAGSLYVIVHRRKMQKMQKMSEKIFEAILKDASNEKSQNKE